MFGKKLPLKQPPPQVYEEEYSQDESEPLIEEVDPSYEPTEKEVREYAIQTLGMKLPEDENLLYLAREGLKAPITTNWVPYQSRNGQIYYKHNITQQKTYDHPTDTEYRKKYEQIKQKAARKNLKSMSLKRNLGMQGLLPNNSLAGGLGLVNNSGLGGGLSNVSGFSGADQPVEPTIDEELLMQYEAELAEFEKKQEKQWREWQQEAEQEHQKKLRKIKQQHEQQKNRLQGKSSKKTASRVLQQQQAKLQQQLEEAQQSTLNAQLKVLEREEENKLLEYRAVYQEDNKIKLKKLEQELQNNYQQKSRQLQQKLRKQQQKRQKQKQHRIKTLQETREQLQNPANPEIASLLQQSLTQSLESLKLEYQKKLQQKAQELEHQLAEMRKILGVDPAQNLALLAGKKERLLGLSELKLKARRSKEVQCIEGEMARQLEVEKARLREKMERECQERIQNKKKQLQQRYNKARQQIETQTLQALQTSLTQLHEAQISQKHQYQTSMNKKLSQLRMQYINSISNPQKQKEKEKEEKLVTRAMMQERESRVKNMEELVGNLERQLELVGREWRVRLFQEEIGKRMGQGEGEVLAYLKDKMKQMNITYKSPQLAKFTQNLQSLQTRYKADKKLLTKILKGIQDTTAYNLHQLRRTNLEADPTAPMGLGLGSGALIKKYNEDVRKMRENQDLINRYQMLVRKLEIGGQGGQGVLEELRGFGDGEMGYREIGLRGEIERTSYGVKNLKHQNMNQQLPAKNLQEYQPPTDPNPKSPWLPSSSTQSTTMQQALRQHSQFLSNVKNQLNRKLYQIRYDYRH